MPFVSYVLVKRSVNVCPWPLIISWIAALFGFITRSFLVIAISLASIFILAQCGNSVLDNDPIPYPSFDYTSVVCIARITENSADWSLCIMDSIGNNMRKIVELTTNCSKPVRSRSGDKLLFSRYTFDYKYELYSVNTDGSNLTLIDRSDFYCGNPDWSPDDKYIVYVRGVDHYWNSSDLVLYNTSEKTHKTLNVIGDVKHNPKFSPNGKQILYCAEIKADTIYMHSHRNHHIYKIDVNGKNNKLIIKEASAPLWSPQGDKIVYYTTGIDGSSQISVANADGSGQKQLTTSVSPGWWDTGFPRDGNGNPKWTPDGQKIVYVSHENEKSEIFIMDVDGSNKIRLTKAEVHDQDPEITPNGQYILYTSRRLDNTDCGIAIMTLDGKNQRILSKIGIYPIACK